jgi:hypothetical protein
VPRDTEIHRMALRVARGLLGQEFVRAKGDEARIADRIGKILLRSFADEEALEQEAERLATAHSRQMVGMDHHRVVRGIMERLARERSFPL